MTYWPHSDPEPPTTAPDYTEHRCERDGCRDWRDEHDCILEGCPPRPATEWRDHQRPQLTAQTFCPHCTTLLARKLAELPEMYVSLYLALEPGSAAGERVSGSRTAPVPLAAEVEALMAETVRLLSDAEADLRTFLGWPTPLAESQRRAPAHVTTSAGSTVPGYLGDSRGGFTITRTVQFLTTHVESLLCLPADTDGKRTANVLLTHHRKIRRVIGLAEGERVTAPRRAEPCPSCERKALREPVGEQTVECGYCGRTWPKDKYERMFAISVLAHREEA